MVCYLSPSDPGGIQCPEVHILVSFRRDKVVRKRGRPEYEGAICRRKWVLRDHNLDARMSDQEPPYIGEAANVEIRVRSQQVLL